MQDARCELDQQLAEARCAPSKYERILSLCFFFSHWTSCLSAVPRWLTALLQLLIAKMAEQPPISAQLKDVMS